MVVRSQNWFRQAERDLEVARRLLDSGDYEWACFVSQQAAEKAVKAVYQRRNADVLGHAVSALLRGLEHVLAPQYMGAVTPELVDRARELDLHYIPPRYPNAHPQGAPFEYFTRPMAERALEHAGHVLRCSAQLLAQLDEGPRQP